MAEAELSSQRNKVAPKSSSASTNLFIGVPFKILALLAVGVPSSLNNNARFCAETKNPGAIALHLIPVPAKCVASHCVKLEIPAFAAE